MKKVLISTLMVFSTAMAFSQINQGQWLVGGNAAFESGKHGDNDNTKYTNFQLSPNAGYFFINNFAGGARVNLATVKYKSEEDATTVFSFAPFVRYYFLPAAQKVNVLADGSFGFGSMKNGSSESFNEFAISAGPAVFLSPNTALELLLQYRSAGGDAYGDDRLNRFGATVGFQVHLGNAKK